MIAETVAANGQLHVPELFWYEVGNGLRTAELRRRISVDDVDAAAAALRDLPFVGSSAAAADDIMNSWHSLYRTYETLV